VLPLRRRQHKHLYAAYAVRVAGRESGDA
jgi:hypothetical protein